MKILAAALALILPAPGLAQPPADMPDPSAITLPDMSGSADPAVWEDGWKHFYFHKDGVSYAEAYADFTDCYRFLPRGSVTTTDVRLPMFAPWRERAPDRRMPYQPNPYGVV